MRISKRTLIVSVLGIIFILGCGAGAAATPANLEPASTQPAAPAATEPPSGVTEVPLIILPTSIPTSAPAFTPQPAMPERRRLTVEFPPRIRAGDSDVVRLTLEVDDLGNLTPTAEIGGHEVTGQVVEIPNLYETHQVIAEARFDIAGMEIRPADLVSEPLTQGTSAVFYWSVRPQQVGDYR